MNTDLKAYSEYREYLKKTDTQYGILECVNFCRENLPQHATFFRIYSTAKVMQRRLLENFSQHEMKVRKEMKRGFNHFYQKLRSKQ